MRGDVAFSYPSTSALRFAGVRARVRVVELSTTNLSMLRASYNSRKNTENIVTI
jgi:hypothetical protein